MCQDGNEPINIMSDTKNSEAAKKLESGAEHAKKALDAATEAGKAVGETVKKQATSVLETGKEHLGAAAKDLSEAATAKVSEFRGQAKQVADQYRSKAQNVQSDVEDYIRESPLKAIGIAIGIGFVLGVIFRR
jgi:ElaB/YqjD/DUF883 family membrane-anchored ribosome-binding protein